MRVRGAASAADVLLVAGRVDNNGVLEGACIPSVLSRNTASQNFPGVSRERTDTASIQWPHVEDVDALHLSENFETLQTGGLLEIGGDGSGLRTRANKVGLGLDLCRAMVVSNWRFSQGVAAARVAARQRDWRAAGWQHVRSSFL